MERDSDVIPPPSMSLTSLGPYTPALGTNAVSLSHAYFCFFYLHIINRLYLSSLP
jgi:hypothetical protein